MKSRNSSTLTGMANASSGGACNGWRDIKVGGEWAGGYKASYHGNKLAGRKEGIRNKIEVRYHLWIFSFLTFSFH